MGSYKLHKLNKLTKLAKPVNHLSLWGLAVYRFSEFRTSVINRAAYSLKRLLDTRKTD